MMSSTIITPFCITMGQKMSEFRKALFIVSSLLCLLWLFQLKSCKKYNFSIHKANFYLPMMDRGRGKIQIELFFSSQSAI